MNDRYWLDRVDHRGGGMFIHESTNLGELITMIGEYVRKGEYMEDFRIRKWEIDPISGDNTYKTLKLTLTPG